MELISQIRSVQQSKTRLLIDKRLREFYSFTSRNANAWFCELCYCLLTANAKATTAGAIERTLGAKGFLNLPEDKLAAAIKNHKHRFHNTKARRICEARKLPNIKKIITSQTSSKKARWWLVQNVRGLGLKEASHFLRNVGYNDVAIIDRHVISILAEHKIIRQPKTLTKKRYLYIERKLTKLCRELGMSHAELDLYLWYLKTGKVLK